jgi:hypothetical protein
MENVQPLAGGAEAIVAAAAAAAGSNELFTRTDSQLTAAFAPVQMPEVAASPKGDS